MSRLLTKGVIAARKRTWFDPLLNIPFSLRVQTHLGDRKPIGLYKDTECTTPATEDGDPVAAWRDEIFGTGKTIVQSTETRRFTLKFVNGVPVLRTDGVDDFLQISGASSQWPTDPFFGGGIEYTAAGNFIRIMGFGAYFSPAEVSLGTHFNSRYRLTTSGGSDDLSVLLSGTPDGFISGRYDNSGVGEVGIDDEIEDGSVAAAIDVSGLPFYIGGMGAASNSQIDITSCFIASGADIGPVEFARIKVYANSLRP